MKTIFQTIFLMAAGTCLHQAVLAQRGIQLNLSYNIATPLRADFKEYVNTTSTRGGQASILYGFTDQLKAGVQGSFSNFYKKYGRQVYTTTSGSTVSAVLSNTLQTIPLVVKGEYSFLKSGLVRPYAGLGAGINLVNLDQFVGEFEYNVNYVKAAFTGDIGLLIPLKKNSHYGFRISTSYNLLPFNEQDINRLDTWNAQAGITIPINK